MSNFNKEVCEYNYSTPFTENYLGFEDFAMAVNAKNARRSIEECENDCIITSQPKICYDNCMSVDCLQRCGRMPKGSNVSKDCYNKCI